MAAVMRKRKIVDTHWGNDSAPQPARSTQQRPRGAGQVRAQPSIARFGRVSKTGVPSSLGTKKLLPVDAVPPADAREALVSGQVKKRKLQPVEPASSLHTPARPVTPPPPPAPAPGQQPVRHIKARRQPPSKPGEPRRIAPLKRNRLNVVTDSPTQGARAILEAFILAPTTASQERAVSPSPAAGNGQDARRQELISLHAAFLSALSLHYAHEGTSTPADLRQLTASIARIWGRRRVTTEDVQRVMGVQMWKENGRGGMDPEELPSLEIVDFGKGKLGIEYEPNAAAELNTHTSPLPIASLKDLFTANLEALSGAELPLAPITPFVSQVPSNQSRGAGLLADLKASAINAQSNIARSEGRGKDRLPVGILGKERPGSAQPAFRSASLLARICAKEEYAATLPAAPSSEDRARVAALQRLEEVIPVIEVLISQKGGTGAISQIPTAGSGSSMGASAASRDLAADLGLGPAVCRPAAPSAKPTQSLLSDFGLGTAQQRKASSFTMPTLVQHLQQSLKHPIAKEEGERCMRLLTDEVLPAWASFRRVGKAETVCFRGTMSRRAWRARIAELLAGEEQGNVMRR